MRAFTQVLLVLLPLAHAANLISLLLLLAEVAVLTQRDVLASTPLDRILSYGVHLNSLVLNRLGYTLSLLPAITQLLASGVRTLLIDTYYNQYTDQWQLCPAPFFANTTTNATISLPWQNHTYSCSPSFSIELVMLQLRNYLQSTSTPLEANFFQLVLFLKPIVAHEVTNSHNQTVKDPTYAFSAPQVWGTSSLADSLAQISSYIYTPLDMQSWQATNSSSSLTPLKSALMDSYRRVLINVPSISRDLGYDLSANDNQTLFTPDIIDISVTSTADTAAHDECVDLLNQLLKGQAGSRIQSWGPPRFRYVADSSFAPFTNATLKNYARCGYNPILKANVLNSSSFDAARNYAASLAGYALWSFAPDQPSPVDSVSLVDTTSNISFAADTRNLTRCIQLDWDGWKVANCNNLQRIACRHPSNTLDWQLSKTPKLFFDAFLQHVCPDRYAVNTPRLAQEQLALLNAVGRANALLPVWIDLNDIVKSGCFVLGGPYQQCPYYHVVNVKDLVGMLAPSASVALFVLVLVWLERAFHQNPIVAHRKNYWKKRIAEEQKLLEPEGVAL